MGAVSGWAEGANKNPVGLVNAVYDSGAEVIGAAANNVGLMSDETYANNSNLAGLVTAVDQQGAGEVAKGALNSAKDFLGQVASGDLEAIGDCFFSIGTSAAGAAKGLQAINAVRAARKAEGAAAAAGKASKPMSVAPAAESKAVRPGQTGTYKELKAQKSAFGESEVLQMDHQPSFAAQVAAREKALGRTLTPAERDAIKSNSPAVASPKPVHEQTSPTYGGRNTPARIAADAADLTRRQLEIGRPLIKR